MQKKKKSGTFVLCIDGDSYPASLELGKVYRTLPDRSAASHGLIRIIDESGEDYLYPKAMFTAIKLPQVARRALSLAS